MKQEIIEAYEKLKKLPTTATAAAKRQRGFHFENVLKAVLEEDNLDPRIRIRVEGEEIDGSFVLGDRGFLLEAKWYGEPLPASQIYAFKAKVDGKLVGTIGVFVSISGYSPDAVDALRVGKTLNVILFDQSDFEAALEDSFRIVLLWKLRHAADQGEVYFPYRSEQVFYGEVPDKEFVASGHGIRTEMAASGSSADIVIICEGNTDKLILTTLAKKVLAMRRLDRRVTIIVALGKRGLSLLANGLQEIASPRPKIMLIADSDGDPEGTEKMLRDSLEADVFRIIIIHPTIAAWLFPGDENPNERLGAERGAAVLKQRVEEVDTGALERNDSGFAEFVKVITG